VVLDDPAAAAAATAGGADVVLIVAPSAGAPGGPAAAVPGSGPGRLAVLVGDPADPAVRRAAEEMDAELFAGVTSRR
jgi:F420-dependent methylenetetrahydromethanopterin dehydrogenase